jgi:ribose transport system substrate-binding protein
LKVSLRSLVAVLSAGTALATLPALTAFPSALAVGANLDHQATAARRVPQAKPFTVGFANEATYAPFQLNVQNSMIKYGKQYGFKVIALNNAYDDATALRNAQILVNDKVNFCVEFQVDSKIAPEIAQIFRKAHIPCIAIDIPQPGAIFFGANNFSDGQLAGQACGLYAKTHGWKPSTTVEVLLNLPAAGAIPQLRMDGLDYGFRQEFPGLSKSALIEQNGDGVVGTSQTVMAEILPRIPTTDHIYIAAINDESALGALRAVQVAGRESSVVVCSQGADGTGLKEIRTDPHWLGDTAYFPEFYGKYIMQVIAMYRAHKAVTPYVFMPRVFLCKANVASYYPGNITVAIKSPAAGPEFSSSPKKELYTLYKGPCGR